MSEKYYILHLEDNPNDAELLRYALEGAEVNCLVKTVDCRAAYEAALQKESFDIILADFSLPDYNGMAAFEEAQRQGLDIPFVLVTGALGEERAIECIKAGMDDYVLKTNLTRLATVVPRAIHEKNAQWQHSLALENLRLSEERFDLAVRGSGAGIWDWPQVSSEEMFWSPRIFEVIGYKEGDIEPSITNWENLILAEDREVAAQVMRAHLEEHAPLDAEYRMLHKEGHPVWIRVRGSALWGDDGKPVRMAGYIQDVTDRKVAEAENRRLTEHYRTITHTINEAIILLDTDGKIDFWNPAAREIFGFSREEAMGADLHQLLAPERYHDAAYKGMAEYFRSGKGPAIDKTLEVMGMHRDGQEIPLELSLASIEREGAWQAIGVVRDISERKAAEKEVAELQKQLAQTQKMEAIGTLAGGIAHDFNNILAAIIGYASLVKTRLPQGSRELEDMQKVLQAGDRAKSLVRQILTFARKTELDKQPVAIDLVVKEVLQLLRASLPATIEIKSEIDAAEQMVLGSPTEIHQVMMNLCTNAFHAMEEKGGVLDVRLRHTCVTGHSLVRDGCYLQLSVKDTGAGIPPEIRDRIFDPYFTTKEINKGTGLGLSMVMGIARRLGGYVEVESAPGAGSCFSVWFPCHTESLLEEKKIMDVLPGGGSEHILYVDDEEGLAILGQEFLEDMGYRVTPMFSSSEALAAFKAEPDSFDLIVTDQTMPDLTGVELAMEVEKIAPGKPVVLCSGFKMTLDSPGVSETSIREVLLKPEVFDKLPGVLREIFDNGD